MEEPQLPLVEDPVHAFKQKVFDMSRHWRQVSPDAPVYHYTSPAAFAGIISSSRIWLTNAAYLNDHGELTYPVLLGAKVLDEMRGRIDAELIERARRELRLHSAFKSWHVASFSLAGNLLSQWRSYCGSGGDSIGFGANQLIDALKKLQYGR